LVVQQVLELQVGQVLVVLGTALVVPWLVVVLAVQLTLAQQGLVPQVLEQRGRGLVPQVVWLLLAQLV